MTDSTLAQGGEPQTASDWMRRTVLVIFSLGLLVAIGVVFTRSIAARVPAQRATLEKLITDRTGLSVRFDNVHFAWGFDGTSAVFEHVELNDPGRGRVRVVAPELRVQFDTWDFLRHQQFSLGRVTIKSPDIDIIGDPEPEPVLAGIAPRGSSRDMALPQVDEAELVRRVTSWAELMPVGRVEVEGARVHLLRRGERKARHHITLSQAVVSRGTHDFNAFGTMLLSQDIGQSLFVAAKLDDLGGSTGVSGELRVIARRVLLDKLPAPGAQALVRRGRGTLDAKFLLGRGRVESGSWTLSARELELPRGQRFDHFTVNGSLHRRGQDLLLEFNDLQVTRGARLERAPRLEARLSLAPGSTRIVHGTFESPKVPFMAAELIAGAFAPTLAQYVDAWPAEWIASAGELHDLRFDSRDGQFTALVRGVELSRASDQARISRFGADVRLDDGGLSLTFDPAESAQVSLPAREPRAVALDGSLSVREHAVGPQLQFSGLQVSSGEGSLRADGAWGTPSSGPLTLELTRVDRELLRDAWALLALDAELPPLDSVHQGEIVAGRLSLIAGVDDSGQRAVNWQRSRASLTLAGLAGAMEGSPPLADAAGTLEMSRTGTQLHLSAGRLEDLHITEARVDWPRKGAPRLRTTLQGDLSSPLLRQMFVNQGLERLTGSVILDADARGAEELRQPGRWRVTARLADAQIALGDGLPAIDALAGTVRYANGELRGLALEGTWLGGPVQIGSRRATRGGLMASLSGSADAATLLELLGQPEATAQVSGAAAWSGTLEHDANEWQLTLASSLAGIESRLPAPFEKSRGRLLPVSATLRFGPQGVREYTLSSGRDSLRGRVEADGALARFDVQGVAGEWRSATDAAGESQLAIERLELKRAPLLLAAAGALLPVDADLRVQVADLRQAGGAVGALGAALSRREDGIEFSLDSADGAPHRLGATGRCFDRERLCRMTFTVDTHELQSLLDGARLPAEWPTRSLQANGQLEWRSDAPGEFMTRLSGRFELETQGVESHHVLTANASLAEGEIELRDIQGSGPEADQVFRGAGRVGLLARTYDLTVDYERVALAATAVPSPARTRIARAWTVIRGSAAQRGWTEAVPARRVQWQGTWD